MNPSFFRQLTAATTVLLLALLSVPAPTHAQLAADRPGFGDGALTVERGGFQTELGYAFRGNGLNQHMLGQLLLRFGVTNAVEVRGGVGSYVVNASPVDNGYNGTAVGAKVSLFRNSVSALSGIATVGLPTGSGLYDTPDDRARQEVKLAFAGALGEGLLLSINAGSQFFYAGGLQDDRAVEWLFIPSLTVSVSESVEAYVGYAGFYTDASNQNWVESGLTFFRRANTQFDVNSGLQVGSSGDAFFLGVGLVHRF